MKKKILIICADRDDDVGRKTKFKGPVVGREENIKLATALGLSDPEDSDTNAIFEAVRVYDQLAHAENAGIATITGHKEEGIKADKEIIRQLDKITEKFEPDGIVFVSDGASDEFILPLLNSKARIVSVRRVVIKQSERYEGLYYALQNFLKHSLENPRLARLVFGMPAIVLILFSMFGFVAWRFILGVLGAYLLIKGFQLEGLVGGVIDEAKFSLKTRKISFFMYIASTAVGMIAISKGYSAAIELGPEIWYKLVGAFTYNSVFIFFVAEIMLLVGWLISRPSQYKQATNLIILGFALNFLLYSAAEVVLFSEKGLFTFGLSLVLGFLIIITTFALESHSKSR